MPGKLIIDNKKIVKILERKKEWRKEKQKEKGNSVQIR